MKNPISRRYERLCRVAQRPIAKVIALAVIAAAIAFLLIPQSAASETPQAATSTPPVPLSVPAKVAYSQKEIADWKQEQESTVAAKLASELSPADARVALAILKQESDLNTHAQNFNCWYSPEGVAHETREKGDKSHPCKPADRPLTWSVDCGVAQVNIPLKTCPEYSFSLDWGIAKMVAMHKERGFSPWVAYTSGLYIPFLD